MEAARLFRGGLRPAEVARQLGVSVQAANVWYQTWEREGAQGLEAAGRAGRLPKLDDGQLRRVERVLLKGALAHGYNTDVWTLERVAGVIQELTGVRHHPGHVWRILRAMGWSRQKPARRATERNEEEIQRWVKQEWPRIKGGPGPSEPGSSSRTRAASP